MKCYWHDKLDSIGRVEKRARSFTYLLEVGKTYPGLELCSDVDPPHLFGSVGTHTKMAVLWSHKNLVMEQYLSLNSTVKQKKSQTGLWEKQENVGGIIFGNGLGKGKMLIEKMKGK